MVNATDSADFVDLDSFSVDNSAISQSWDVFPNQKIKSVGLLDPVRLLVVTESEMTVVRVDNCGRFSNCGLCVGIRDPHCGWDRTLAQCVSRKSSEEELLQDVTSGDNQRCPPGMIRFN